MSYSNLYFQPKQTISKGLIVIAFFSFIGFLGLIFSGDSIKQSKASARKLTKGPEVVNLLPLQAGVYWQSSNNEIGALMYGLKEDNLSYVSDYRDTENNQNKYISHYVLLTGLKEETTYYYKLMFKIDSRQGLYTDINNKAFVFKTPKNIDLRSSIQAASGFVYGINSQPAVGAFVIFNFTNKLPLLAITQSGGSFVIPLNYLVETRADNNINLVLPNEEDKIDIEIFDNNLSSKIIAKLSQTHPLLQSVTLGQNYDFIQQSGVLGVNSINTTAQTDSANNSKNDYLISIIYPKENSIIPGNKPLIKGRAIPGKDVFITINSQPEYNFRTQVDKKGEWKITLEKPIKPGNYTISLTTEDEKGEKFALSRQFTIAKSGEQVLGEATDESSLITPSPTQAPSPTIGDYAYLTPTSAPPNTGLDNSMILSVGSSLVIIGLGILLVF